MAKIKVVHYCNQLSIGGTERSMELFCKYLDKSKFDVYALSRVHREPFVKRARLGLGAAFGHKKSKAKLALLSQMNARIPNFKNILGEDHVLFAQTTEEMKRILSELKPDILHVWYSGRAEPPTSEEDIMSSIPVTLTTNSFEIQNTAPAHRLVKRFYFPSTWVLENAAQWAKGDKRAGVFYSPIEKPLTQENLRLKLGIKPSDFVVGRVGRPDPGIHDAISLRAYARIQNDSTVFLALSPPGNMVEEAKALGVKRFIALPPVDQETLPKFYNTIDVLAHARRDGETFGCNIAEAMIHGKPVISHFTDFMNAQEEVIGSAGFVCEKNNDEQYAEQLKKLRDDVGAREKLSRTARERALEQFEVERLTQRLQSTYLELLQEIHRTPNS